MSEKETQFENDIATESREELQEPPMYQVLLLNDDYTSMDFVVQVLQKFFQKTFEEANEIMLQIHHKGSGVCGVYPKEIAETKVAQVLDDAKKNEFPLQCKLQKV